MLTRPLKIDSEYKIISGPLSDYTNKVILKETNDKTVKIEKLGKSITMTVEAFRATAVCIDVKEAPTPKAEHPTPPTKAKKVKQLKSVNLSFIERCKLKFPADKDLKHHHYIFKKDKDNPFKIYKITGEKQKTLHYKFLNNLATGSIGKTQFYMKCVTLPPLKILTNPPPVEPSVSDVIENNNQSLKVGDIPIETLKKISPLVVKNIELQKNRNIFPDATKIILDEVKKHTKIAFEPDTFPPEEFTEKEKICIRFKSHYPPTEEFFEKNISKEPIESSLAICKKDPESISKAIEIYLEKNEEALENLNFSVNIESEDVIIV